MHVRTRLILTGCLAIMDLMAVSTFWQHHISATIAVGIISIILFSLWASWTHALLFIVAAICGPLTESVAIHFGAWQYAYPFGTLPIPLWLPLLWGDAAILIIAMKHGVEYLKGEIE